MKTNRREFVAAALAGALLWSVAELGLRSSVLAAPAGDVMELTLGVEGMT